MIPRIDVETFIEVPEGDLWLPDFEDLDDDGFGFFHDKWLLTGVTEADVLAVRTREKELLQDADGHSRSSEEFDIECRLLEFPSEDFEDGLGRLEIGVAGLSYVLNLIGAGTAASCRGHVGPTGWTQRPVVYLAAEQPWVSLISESAEQHGCGLALCEDRLLTIWAPSVADTVNLT